MSTAAQRLARARLYLVCDRPSRAFLDAALSGGVEIVQLRMKTGTDAQILQAAETVADACAAHGALFILNDRPDLVEAAGADGVHLGQDDVPVWRAREIVGPAALVGLSTHTPTQVDAAGEVDYIGVGPVFATPTKPGRPAVGLYLVRYATEHAPVPWFAIGGITTDNVGGVVGAGAERVAVVRALTQSEDAHTAAARLRAAVAPQEARIGAA